MEGSIESSVIRVIQTMQSQVYLKSMIQHRRKETIKFKYLQ